MKPIEYVTGRDYGRPQVLKITNPANAASHPDSPFVSVYFDDAVRGIAGAVTILATDCNARDIGPAVLRQYDTGRYTEMSSRTLNY
jgi:hypothetical protein